VQAVMLGTPRGSKERELATLHLKLRAPQIYPDSHALLGTHEEREAHGVGIHCHTCPRVEESRCHLWRYYPGRIPPPAVTYLHSISTNTNS
jgi:hypothetical protein